MNEDFDKEFLEQLDLRKVLNFIPNICPSCETGMCPKILGAVTQERPDDTSWIYIGFECPVCHQVFFSQYLKNDFDPTEKLIYIHGIGDYHAREKFPEELDLLKSKFEELYNQALVAQNSGCADICGIGFRLAFEHLIKDFAIYCYPEKKQEIENMTSLEKCINEFVQDPETKELLAKSGWIGNDFAHYNSKHPEFDVENFKELIRLCANEIVSYIKKQRYKKAIIKK